MVADVLKRGLTVPVYKGAENDLNLDSYRRVTVTSMVAKVLEFLVLEWLQPVFMEASLAHVNQSRQCHVGTPSLLPKRLWPGISESQRWESCLHVTCRRLWTQGEYNHWTGLLDWTTGLTQTAKYTSFSAEQKLNVLIPSVTSLTLLPTVSFQRTKVMCIFNYNKFTFGGFA